MKRPLWILALGCLSLAVLAQEAAEPPPDEAPAEDAPVTAQAEDPAADGDESPVADEEEPDAEALAEAAAAAGGQVGEVEEEFTPEDEISEDYPVPLPADI